MKISKLLENLIHIKSFYPIFKSKTECLNLYHCNVIMCPNIPTIGVCCITNLM